MYKTSEFKSVNLVLRMECRKWSLCPLITFIIETQNAGVDRKNGFFVPFLE